MSLESRIKAIKKRLAPPQFPVGVVAVRAALGGDEPDLRFPRGVSKLEAMADLRERVDQQLEGNPDGIFATTAAWAARWRASRVLGPRM